MSLNVPNKDAFFIGIFSNMINPFNSRLQGNPHYEEGKTLAEQFREGLESRDEVYLAGFKNGCFMGEPRLSGVPLYNKGIEYGQKCWKIIEEQMKKKFEETGS